ncbi:error-prone DNA polymerase [Anaerolineaceae bacterium]|nr:error-prone DNA polymerase [Anaerolineaceae bacterium]
MSYVELHAHSYYSLLDGVPTPEALVAQAVQYQMPALALTDHDALYGAPRFWRAAQAAGIKPIFGCELTLAGAAGHLTLLAETQAGYANLCQLITLARNAQTKGSAALPRAVLAAHSAGLIALSGCRGGVLAQALRQRQPEHALQLAARLAQLFGRNNFFIELQRHHERGDRARNCALQTLASQLQLPLVATGNVHYLESTDAPLHDVLTCIRSRVALEHAGSLLRTNAEYRFRTPQEMAALFAEWPAALANTLVIAARCQAQLPHGPQQLPKIELPPGVNAAEYLTALCQAALQTRVAAAAAPAYRETLARELEIISEQQLANYFLVVWDLVRFARQRGILCQGRGSAANSLTAYLLGITPVDPLAAGLVFERFLSRERITQPDIDIDFAADRREEAIQYLYQKYGPAHTAMACTMITFRARSALRDAGLALGFAPALLDRACAAVDDYSAGRLPDSSSLRAAFGAQLDTPRWQQLLQMAARLAGFPRHLGLHNGGMILCAQPLTQHIPVEPASMEARSAVQWDKDALEMADWIKLDVLGLRMLSAIDSACRFVSQHTGSPPDLSALSFDDAGVYAMLCRGETIGVFQVESRAQAALIPKFQPRSFADLTVQIALIRPGPVQANMVHPYLRRRSGREPVVHLHPSLAAALGETLGVILFQEQVLKVARDLAGFSAGEGELLRRALSHKHASAQLETFRQRFIAGAQQRAVNADTAQAVFEQLKAFGGYSFSKAHAAAFAVITYWSAWLRHHHPLQYFAGLLCHQPMGFYAPHVVVSDARRIGVRFLPVHIQHSQAAVTVEQNAIRLGLGYVDGLGAAHIELLERARPFHSLLDLVQRTRLPRPQLEALILAGALDCFGERRALLWEMAGAYRTAQRPPALPLPTADEHAQLHPLQPAERLAAEYAATGITVAAHLSSLRRAAFAAAGTRQIASLRTLRNGQPVTVGGVIVTVQRPPTAKGMCFLALEDSSGLVNIVVPPQVYAQYRSGCRAPFALVCGRLQLDGGAVHVVAQRVEPV